MYPKWTFFAILPQNDIGFVAHFQHSLLQPTVTVAIHCECVFTWGFVRTYVYRTEMDYKILFTAEVHTVLSGNPSHREWYIHIYIQTSKVM